MQLKPVVPSQSQYALAGISQIGHFLGSGCIVGNPEVMAKVPINGEIGKVRTSLHMSG
jgi:hypothetical protein